MHYEKGEFPGAPWHPHRGFDTVTYLKAGEGEHRDSMGNAGILREGDCQWMTAASGIVHDEGRNHPGGTLHGRGGGGVLWSLKGGGVGLRVRIFDSFIFSNDRRAKLRP